MVSFGARIKQLRTDRGWTQEELARKMGYKSKSTINKIELGVNDIPQSKIGQFAQVLGVTPGYLMGLVTEEESKKTDQLARLVLKMKNDNDFYNTVLALAKLNEKQYRGIKDLIAAFDE
jgi:transcriptional regulator with XRE-family HTH domain